MRRSSILCIKILYALLIATLGDQLSKIQVYSHPDCPFTSDVLGYCFAQFSACKNQKSTFSFCYSQYRSCTKITLPSNEHKCDGYIKDVDYILNKTKPEFQENFMFKWPDGIETVVIAAENQCGLNILNNTLKALKKLHQQLATNECVVKHKPELDVVSIQTDFKTSKNLPIPFDRSRCGWQFGYIGKVFFRNWINSECGWYAVDFNHCCAEHFNCYMNQYGKEVCDDNFSNCLNVLVLRMTSYKASCQSFTRKLSQELQFDENDYEVFKETEITTEIETFSGKLHVALSPSDTNFLNYTQIKVFLLGSDSSLDPEVRAMFNNNAYKLGWRNRVIIDSSALIFEECRGQEKMMVCLTRFGNNLQSIERKTEHFEQFLEEFNVTVSSQLHNILTKKDFEKLVDNNNNSTWTIILTIWEILITIYLVGKDIFKCYKRCKRPVHSPPSETISPSASDSLINQSQPGIVRYSRANEDTVDLPSA